MNLDVRRWASNGHDRAYVNERTGPGQPSVKVGWVDLSTGDVHPEPGTDADVLWTAVANWAIRSKERLPGRGVTHAPRHVVQTGSLAGNKAGASLTTQASTRSRGLLARLVGKDDDAKSWRTGAKGEAKAARHLDRVGHGWTATHSVTVGTRGADIDHILVGPGGVVTVNTKTHPRGTVKVHANGIWVNGSRVDYVTKARTEADIVSNALARLARKVLPVRPALLFVDTATVDVTASPGVDVLTLDTVAPWLLGRGAVFTSTQVEWLVRKVRDPETWS